MSEREVLVATRSANKLREIRDILGERSEFRIIGPEEAGLPESPEEEGIEAFPNFEENALAKARWFAARTQMTTLADDSGLCVDALGGEPGVRSKRFSGRTDLPGAELDAANNRLLLNRLEGVPTAGRGARYVCVAALCLEGGGERSFRGECEGVILDRPRGGEGFGYDPLFFLPGEGRSFGELSRARKNAFSHRGIAFAAVGAWLRVALDATPRRW